MTIDAGPALRHLERRVILVEFPLVLLALADLVQRELLDPLDRVVAAQQHLYELVDGRPLRDQEALVLGLYTENTTRKDHQSFVVEEKAIISPFQMNCARQ